MLGATDGLVARSYLVSPWPLLAECRRLRCAHDRLHSVSKRHRVGIGSSARLLTVAAGGRARAAWP
jgi:hypothetical protein